MANEVDLNNLTIKIDTLPDNWKMLLVDPSTGHPAQSMSVARFIELLATKLPLGLNSGIAADYSFGVQQREKLTELNVYPMPWKITCHSYSSNSGHIPAPTDNANTLLNISNGVHPQSYGFQIAFQASGIYVRNIHADTFNAWNKIVTSSLNAIAANALTEPISLNNNVLPPPPANCVPNSSQSAGSIEQFAMPALSDSAGKEESIQVDSEKQYTWSIDKIGHAVLELQKENEQLKKILEANGIEVNSK